MLSYSYLCTQKSKTSKQNIRKTLANKEKEKKMNAKQRAYEKKQEQEGRKVVNWIFGVLIVVALAFCLMSIYMYG